MNTALLLLAAIGHQHCPPPVPYYPYYNPYYTPMPPVMRVPTPSTMTPPPFAVRPAPVQPQREKPAVQVPASVYGGSGGPVIIENPYYKPTK